MLKKITAVAVVLLSLLLFASCGQSEDGASEPETVKPPLPLHDYMSNLSDEQTASLESQLGLFQHPFKDAIARFGDEYELTLEDDIVSLTFENAGCTFQANIFESFTYYKDADNTADFSECDINECNIMEYASYAVIDRIVFDVEGTVLTDGIRIGMTFEQISKQLHVEGIEYDSACAARYDDYNERGESVDMLMIYGETPGFEYILCFENDALDSVKITDYTEYLTDEGIIDDDAICAMNDAFAFLEENTLAAFDASALSDNGMIYSPFYDSWFYSRQFTRGEHEGYQILVEKSAPRRICITSPTGCIPILFWNNGEYVDPVLTFLGRWRSFNSTEYVDVKSISKEGIAVFDMYVDADSDGNMILLENLNTALNDKPQSLDECIFTEMAEGAVDGDMQVFNDDVQSGCYIYGGEQYYLSDSFVLSFWGQIQYIPRSPVGGKLGTNGCVIHLPYNGEYSQESANGYMAEFGRDDPDKGNIVSDAVPAGKEVLNEYLNKLYETSGLSYADLEYTYLYDYVFPVNNTTYRVWQSNDTESPHYLYVDDTEGTIIRERYDNPLSRCSKTLVYKNRARFGSKAYADQVFVSDDGTITVDFKKRMVDKSDAFVKEIRIPEIGVDAVGENERCMFFSDIGDRFMLNGYVLFDHTTWGATLHITDSNIPDFDIGVYHLNGETSLLDPSVVVEDVPEEPEDEEPLDDVIDDPPQESRLVIRDFSGKIIGYVYVKENGDKTVKSFSGKILGYYDAERDVTTDFNGRILTRGDTASALLFAE